MEAIEARTASYRAQGVSPLWLRLCNFERFERVQRLAYSGEAWIERYAVRSWERWAHDQTGGLWFYDAGERHLWRGRFTQAYGWREGSEWYEPGGIYQSNPGGYSPVMRWVGLALEGPYRPEAVRLMRANVGGRMSAVFVPPEGTPRPWPLRRLVRAELLKGSYLCEVCELESCVNGLWAPVQIEAAHANWRRERREAGLN